MEQKKRDTTMKFDSSTPRKNNFSDRFKSAAGQKSDENLGAPAKQGKQSRVF